MEEVTESTNGDSRQSIFSPGKLTAWLCLAVISLSVIACIAMSAVRSTGLTKIKVTALDAASEPRDHNLPLFKKKEALPDYELFLILSNGNEILLGSKPDTSAAQGLTWQVSDPVSNSDVASIRLQEKDKVISDAVAEVQIQGNSVTENGYRFDFTVQQSASIGLKSFFKTPIGIAITTGFTIAVIIVILQFLPIGAFG